ncbi:MAG: integrin alpha, partial [Pirellulaceae bacterium]|nr:integrin alpha [Pirellulaceae bacterium]
MRSGKISVKQSRKRRSFGISAKRSTYTHIRRLIFEPLEERRLMAVIDLAAIVAGQGTTIFGADAGDVACRVSNAGDINGDGFDDILIGAADADAANNLKPQAGEAYLIFGGPSLPVSIDLATLGAAGITIFGAESGDYAGIAVNGAGDINGDGFDDLIIAA